MNERTAHQANHFEGHSRSNGGPLLLGTVINSSGTISIGASDNPTQRLEELYLTDPRYKERIDQDCLRSLCFPSIDARRNDIDLAHQDTCDWLFETAQFQQWQDRKDLPDHNGVLWIKGKPGAGKSTLMKHILVYCRNTFKDHVIGAYFFNARGSKLEKTFLGMLYSLIYQLLEQDLLREPFIPMYLDKRKKHQKWEWNEGELKNFLLSESKKCRPKPVVLLVDALDECDGADVRRVVSFLESLSMNAVNAKARFNICLSSRHYPNISMGKNLELIVEDRKEHDEDIARYIQHKLKGKDKEVEEEVRRKASGIFMWVILVVEMLNQAFDEGKIRAIREKLREVPSDLEEMFRTLLDKGNRDKELTILMLQWVLFAVKPLKPEELYFAVLAGTKTQGLEAWDQSKDTSEVIQRFITSSSKGLIEVRKEAPEPTTPFSVSTLDDYGRGPALGGHAETVQFIHQSVNDFLLRNKRLRTLDPALDSNPIYTSHDKLRACCVSYIMVEELNPLAKDGSEKELNDNYPFLNYASTYLLHHAEKAQAGCITQEALVQWLQRPNGGFERLKSFRNTFEKDYKFRYNTGVELLYTLSLHGYCELARIVLEKGADVNAQGGLYGNTLQAASAQGEGKTVEMLLEKGADVNAQGGLYGNALQAASVQGEGEIVAMLLEKGADVNAQGGFLGSALRAPLAKEERRLLAALIWAASIWAALRWAASIWTNKCSGEGHDGLWEETEVNSEARIYDIALVLAAEKGKEGIVTMLLENGADVNAQGGPWGNALVVASAQGNEEIVAMLLEKGADVNAQGGVWGNALQAASVEGKEKIVTILLEKGADVNAQGGVWGNALQAALKEGIEEIVTILLEKGADVNAQGGLYDNALQAASVEGEEEIVTMLLEKGADVNAQGGVWGNALQAASVEGKEKIVTILLEKGADVNAQGGFWGNALQAASAQGREELVTILLKKGADVNAQGGFCGNALQAASAGGTEKIVTILLEKGADVNAQGGPWGNALQAALTEEKEKSVTILLEKGADVNAKGGLWGDALQAASAQGKEKIVTILLEMGADVNAQGGFWGNALLLAVAEGKEEIVRTLLERRADINDQGEVQGISLPAALAEEYEEILELFLKKRANINT